MSENQQESPRVTVQNYTKIWTLDWVIYAIEGKKLPIPANFRIIGIFLASEVFWIIAGKILFFLPGSYTFLFLPIVTTWLIAKQKLDGKAPHKWLLGMVFYWLRPKHLHRYRKVEHNKRYVYKSKVVYRNTRERA
ncbi:TcpE family conjugal transfer membrane protein [Paenibacillus chitinolyticus]|uniref:TcpE family conjugal transfer membrane protein n=1 Tax=Paenibacillus chitinolyticus TaxID=79263 RepID=UPI00295EC866|nr:TcpE family conjugal transfer membrane protein [Paenibacillus chitinolyticus]